MNETPSRDVEVFTEALQLPRDKRAAYLEIACAGQGELRQKVEALLVGYDQAGDFLEHSPVKTVFESRLGGATSEKPGDRIGRYGLLQQIGEGGFGVVFMAEQEEPVRRRVALKIIKPGMDTKSVITRFEAERQALALMDHPNIAKIFDAGATESGRPYFVMELVRGIKITDYCDHHSLTIKERLELFVQVCRAVQHAHQKGVIHRDIKPSNILVAKTAEGTPQPMVIDFGIAKATTNQQLTDKTLFTGAEMFIGTPAYMSPEQAELTNAGVDTRTDVYSLGVLLYELLTGSTPFNVGDLSKAGIDEVRRVIREQEPARPSTRLSKLSDADLTSMAQRRQSEPPTLIHTVRGDLDWIAMKALEKDRSRRYETAYGLALDVQRYLANEPILARPPSMLYKFQKAVLRNQLFFLGIGLFVLLLVVGLIVVSATLAKERQARREAETASIKSQEVTKFLEHMLNGVGPSVARGRDTTMLREMLDQTAENVGKEITNQPAVEVELRDVLGQLYLAIGNYDQAEKMYRAALGINRSLFGPESKEVAASFGNWGVALDKGGNFQEAELAQRQALDIRQHLFGNENPDVATSLNLLASVLRHQHRLAESELLTREALEIRTKLFGNDSLEAAEVLHNLTVVLGDEDRGVESEATAREMLAIRRKQLGPTNLLVAAALNDLAWAEGFNRKFQEAKSLQLEALEIQRKLLGDEAPDVAKTLSSLGERIRHDGNLKDSEAMLDQALAIQRKLSGENSPDFLYTLSSLASTFEAEGKWAEAELAYRKALASWRSLAGKDDPQALATLDNLGKLLEHIGKFEEAESVDREALAGWRERAGNEDPHTMNALDGLGSTLEREGKWEEAETVRREALAVWRNRPGDKDPQMLYALRNLGLALEAENKWPEAEAVWRESLTAWRKRGGIEEPQSMYTLRKLGLALEAEGKWPEAEAVYREALAISRKQGGDEGPDALVDLDRLVRVLVPQKKLGEAEQLLNQALTPVFVRSPASANLLVRRLDLLGRLGRWQEAAEEAALLLQLQPDDQYNYHRLAGLLAITQNRSVYEPLCLRSLVTFTNTTNPYVDERVAQDCLLLPHSGVDLRSVDKLADAAVTFGGGTDAMPYFQACKAMSDYRLGDYPKAVEWAEKAAKDSRADAPAKGKAYAVLAMAHWQLGQKNIARTMLANGDTLAPNLLPGHEPVDIGESWVAWLFARISLDEAATLIQSGLTNGASLNQK
jgi:serine/threonine protein kinase/Tfp pilus assembly protein PilF